METKIEFRKRCNERFEKMKQREQFVLDNWDKLIAAGVKTNMIDVATCSSVDIDRPTREQALDVIKLFPGKWDKEPCGIEGTLSYTQTISSGIQLRLWGAPPPPSCKLIEEWVDVPARREKRLRLDCGPIPIPPKDVPATAA